MLFVIVVFIIIHLLIPSKTEGDQDKLAETQEKNWTDSLSNSLSDVGQLISMSEEIERFREKWEIKGMSVAIIRNDSLLYAHGFGWADEEKGKPMNPNTIMRIASASKLVTAVAVMKLIEEGKLTLDSKVFGKDGILNDSRYNSSIKDPRMEEITIDHLLRHKGGFSRKGGDPMFNTKEIVAEKQLNKEPSDEELISIVLGRGLGFTPGSGRRYSNFGYFVLSKVIEKITGKSYWDYVEEEILLPSRALGFRPATNYLKDRYENETHYYGPDNEPVEEFNGRGELVERVYGGSNVKGLMGAGGWVTSAPAYARFVASIDGDPRVKDVISQESVALLTEYNEEDKMSRGWSEVDANGKWTRTGTLSSTHALIERFPDGECWVILTNSGVWRGHHFSRDLNRLVEKLKIKYKDYYPRRNLW